MENTDKKLEEVITLLKTMAEDRADFGRIHREEHEYLRVLIEEHQLRKETWLSIQRRVASGTIWALLVAIFSAIIFTVKSYFSSI